MGQGPTSMIADTIPRWDAMRTPETRKVEDFLRTLLDRADAYRYNTAVIRLRVVDPRFEGMPFDDRDELVEPSIHMLPKDTRDDIVTLLTLAPSELTGYNRRSLINLEFDDPTPSQL